MLHHDAITGTSRKQTIEDYFERIQNAENEIEKALHYSSITILG